MGITSQPLDGNGQPVRNVGWDPTNHGFVIAQTAPGTNDATGNYTYGPLIVQQNAAQSVSGTLQNAAAANGNGTALALLGMASVILTVNMAGFTGTVSFQVSEDGSHYDPLQVQQEGTNVITTSVTGATTTSVHVYEGSVAGLQSVQAVVSGFSAGTVTVTAHAIPVADAPRVMNAVPVDGQKATYRASIQGLAAVTGCTDLFTITGSATKTVRVTRIELSGTIATAAMYLDVQGIIRSTANATGTSTSPTVVPLDSNDPAGTAVVRAYTANPGTLGTAVGTITSDKVLLPLTGTPIATQRLVYDFGNRPAKAVVLRGATQVFALNLNAATIANATSIDCAIEWSEE